MYMTKETGEGRPEVRVLPEEVDWDGRRSLSRGARPVRWGVESRGLRPSWLGFVYRTSNVRKLGHDAVESGHGGGGRTQDQVRPPGRQGWIGKGDRLLDPDRPIARHG